MAKETANNGNGWICLHRDIQDWEHFSDPSTVVVFIVLLLNANHKEGWWRGHKCERGATFISIRTIKEITTLSEHTIIRALRLLEQTGEIKRIKIDQKNMKTIICKYSAYQDYSLISGANTATQSATQTATQTATKQQYNNNNNIVVEDINNTHTHEELIADLFSRESTMQAFCMNERITLDECRKIAEAVVIDWELTGETHKTKSQAVKHLLAQIRKKAQAMRLNGSFVAMVGKDERLKPITTFCKRMIDEGQSRDDVSAWFSYWTEGCNDGTGRMRFEAEKAWDNKTRYTNFIKRKK